MLPPVVIKLSHNKSNLSVKMVCQHNRKLTMTCTTHESSTSPSITIKLAARMYETRNGQPSQRTLKQSLIYSKNLFLPSMVGELPLVGPSVCI
jgi:hypothetical protein